VIKGENSDLPRRREGREGKKDLKKIAELDRDQNQQIDHSNISPGEFNGMRIGDDAVLTSSRGDQFNSLPPLVAIRRGSSEPEATSPLKGAHLCH
jgi:hypothetical protein